MPRSLFFRKFNKWIFGYAYYTFWTLWNISCWPCGIFCWMDFCPYTFLLDWFELCATGWKHYCKVVSYSWLVLHRLTIDAGHLAFFINNLLLLAHHVCLSILITAGHTSCTHVVCCCVWICCMWLVCVGFIALACWHGMVIHHHYQTVYVFALYPLCDLFFILFLTVIWTFVQSMVLTVVLKLPFSIGFCAAQISEWNCKSMALTIVHCIPSMHLSCIYIQPIGRAHFRSLHPL